MILHQPSIGRIFFCRKFRLGSGNFRQMPYDCSNVFFYIRVWELFGTKHTSIFEHLDRLRLLYLSLLNLLSGQFITIGLIHTHTHTLFGYALVLLVFCSSPWFMFIKLLLLCCYNRQQRKE